MLASSLVVLSGAPAHAAGDPWSPVDAGIDETLNAVVVLDPAQEPDPEEDDEALRLVVAVGDAGTVMRSENGGDTWTKITVPTPSGNEPPDLRDVHFPSPTTGFAVGGRAEGSEGAVYRTDDAGETWRLSAAFDNLSLYGVWFTSPDSGHAVGQTDAGGTSSRILRTTDGGESWEVTYRGEDDLPDPNRPINFLRSVSFFDANVGVAVGQGDRIHFAVPANLSGLIVRTEDGGATWNRVVVPETDESRHFPGRLAAVWAVGSGAPGQRVAYAVGDATTVSGGGQVWKSVDDGATWVPLPGGSLPVQLADVAFKDADDGHAVGGMSGVPAIFETENGGLTWTANPVLDVPNFVLRGVGYASEDTRLAVGTGGKVLRHAPGAGPDEAVESILDPPPPEVPPPHGDPKCPPWSPASSTDKGAIVEEGTLERAAEQVQAHELALDVNARLLYEFEAVPVHQGSAGSLTAPNRVRAWARDLDTLCLLPDPVLIEDARPDHIAYAPVSVPVVDEGENRLFLVYQRGPSELYHRSHPTEPDRRFSRVTDLGVAVIGPDPQQEADPGQPTPIKQLAAAPFPPGLPPLPNSAQVTASTYHPPQEGSGELSRAKLYIVVDYSNLVSSGNVQLASTLVFVLQADVQRLMDGDLVPFDWMLPVPSCGRTPTDLAGARRAAAVRTDAHVAIACAQGRIVGTGRGTVGGIARVELDDLATPATTRFFPADGARTDQPTLADPVSGRLFIGAITRRGVGLAGFDVARGAWFGFIPEERGITMLALDRQTGNLYVGVGGSSGQIIVSDARSEALPQGRIVEAPIVGNQKSFTPLDWKRGRLFTIDGSGNLRILKDSIPHEKPSPPFDPDTLTRDIDEREGLTGRTFSGGGQAYGARVRWANGSRGIQSHSGFCGAAPLPGPFNRPGSSYCPHDGTRELVLAQVPGANLADSEASAAAVGAEHDGASRQEGTDRDLATLAFEEPDEILLGGGDSEEPDPREQLAEEYLKFKEENAPEGYRRFRDTRRANTVPNRWPYRRVSCADFGGSPREDVASEDGAVFTVPTGSNEGDKRTVPATFSSSTVTCDQQNSLVAAGAVFGDEGQLGPPGQSPFIDAGSTRSSVVSFLDPEHGLVSRVKAEVTGLRLAHRDHGEASIGLLRTVAETRASGRSDPGAAGSFERSIEDVWVKRAGDPEPHQLCDQCDPEAVVAELNRVFGTRAHFDLPEPDPARVGGTPGGAEAVVTRHPQEHTSDVVTNAESQDRLEVPGLLATVFADERTGFSRYIVQLAGVAADSKFGIFCLFGESPAGECNTAPLLSGFETQSDSALAPALGSIDGGTGTAPQGEEFDLAGDPTATSVGPVESGLQPAALLSPPPADGGLPALIRRVIEGFKWIFNSLIDALRSAGLWLLFAAPLILAVRRRWLPETRPQGGK